MNHKNIKTQLQVELQTVGQLKLVSPSMKLKTIVSKDLTLTLKVIGRGVSISGSVFPSSKGKISIDKSSGRPRLVINAPSTCLGWKTQTPNKETTRHMTSSKKLNLYLRANLGIDNNGQSFECKLIGPQFIDGLAVYDIRK